MTATPAHTTTPAANARPMSVAIVIERYDPDGGGAERSTAQIAHELISRGHHVVILAGVASDRGFDGPDVRRFMGSHRKFDAMSLRGFSRWAMRQLEEGRYDVSLSVTTAVPASVVQPRSGTVRETIDRNIALRRSAFSRWLKRTLVAVTPKQRRLLAQERATLTDPRVRRIVSVSRYVSDQLRRHYRVDPSKISLIPNAAVMPVTDDAQRRTWRDEVRQGYGIAETDTVYLFAALNMKLKGARPLLDAFAAIREQGVPATLLMVGSIGYAEQLQAARLGVRDSVKIVGQTSQMAALYCAADVTVLPTFYDPSSKVVIESLMMGTPAISTAFNGASDFIVAGGLVRGRVIPDPHDVEALAAAMRELSDPAERARCAAASAGLAEELSMKRHVDRLEAVLRAAAEK
ncbi:MAG: glycosyltransferase family 4 protein [Planctomycetes bacterium]|nr:glycosyltransferase family 4 protein [Planctomycetota bacterium]